MTSSSTSRVRRLAGTDELIDRRYASCTAALAHPGGTRLAPQPSQPDSETPEPVVCPGPARLGVAGASRAVLSPPSAGPVRLLAMAPTTASQWRRRSAPSRRSTPAPRRAANPASDDGFRCGPESTSTAAAGAADHAARATDSRSDDRPAAAPAQRPAAGRFRRAASDRPSRLRAPAPSSAVAPAASRRAELRRQRRPLVSDSLVGDPPVDLRFASAGGSAAAARTGS